jgi:hypothetical protein
MDIFPSSPHSWLKQPPVLSYTMMELLPAWVLELLGGVEPLGLYSLTTIIFEQKPYPLKINTRLYLIWYNIFYLRQGIVLKLYPV